MERLGTYKRTEEELKESEERYRVVIEHSNDGIAIVNEDRNIFVNRRYLDIFGYPESYDITQKPPLIVVHPDDRPMVMDYITKRRKDEPAPARYEFKGIRPDGTTINIEVSVTGIVYSGEPVSFACFRDITERKRIENELLKNERKFREFFENASEGIFRTTPEGALIAANPAFARMFGYDSPNEVMKEVNSIGRQMYAHPEDRTKVIALLEKENTIRNYEVEFLHKSGHKIWISINAIKRQKSTGETLHYEGTTIDITERHRAEQELIRKEKELRKKSSNLEEANTALKVLLKHREEDKSALENTVITNFKKLVLPYIEKLKSGYLNESQRNYLDVVESNLNEITAPFLEKMVLKHSRLTHAEVQVIDLIRRGKTSKEIAALLNVSKHTIDAHRNNIRSKLGLDKGRANLRSYLENLNK
jgi:PAS domain S-box-containing protein